MTRALITGLLLALAAAAPAAATTTPDARTSACETAVDPAARAVEFTGTMPALTGTRRMQMRFTLLQRRGSRGAYRRVAVPGWSAWETSDPYRPAFIFTKRVESLLAPAAYRAQITFRWLDKAGRRQRQVTRTTGPCVQPDPRPQLLLSAFSAQAGGNGQASYTVAVQNTGRSTAQRFAVTLVVGGVTSAPIGIGPLAPGESAEGAVIAPACDGGTDVVVQIDPGDVVDEADESGHVLTRACPL